MGHQHEEAAIRVRCWIPEGRLREFVETVVRLIGIDRSPPGYRPPYGAVWLDGDRLEERCWDHLRDLLARTGTLTRTWMGFSWRSQSEVRCELQRDEGYDGIIVRIEVAPELVGSVRETAVALGGGAGLTEP